MRIECFQPAAPLRGTLIRYEYFELKTSDSFRGRLRFFPSSVNGFLFSFYQGQPMLLSNRLISNQPIEPTNLLAAVSAWSDVSPVGSLRGIRVVFEPGALARLFGTPLKHFVGRVDNVADSLDRGINDLYQRLGALGIQEAIAALDDYFLRKLRSATTPEPSLYFFLDNFFRTNGYHHSLEYIAGEMGMSSRHLNRLLNYQLGFNFSRLRQLHRFNAALEVLKSQPCHRLGDLAHQLDYFDQAHFIRVFKELSGLRPKDYAAGVGQQRLLFPDERLSFSRSGALYLADD